MSTKKTTGPGVSFNEPDAAARSKLVTDTQAALLAAAAMIKAGRRVRKEDRQWIAQALCAYAETIAEPKARKRGALRKVDHGGLAMRYAWLRVHDKLPDTKALLVLEDEFGISGTQIKTVLTPDIRAEALRQFEGARLLVRKKQTKRRRLE